ncbi:MAG: D-glycero-beta-D-manno-heptose 1,7-bisphosphate 7-phosphatase [Gammaproteobacteria bacterium]|nr:D-glycero-beta-D-manno-heptose 1,7-bisphosphate 7-phosphatase [Gammaproteobacteria bacterium]MCW8839387.1 D-glycero-beta-D-manno-heptose 1,7-bisphosphate 7-phosphatase [Gammaproteobacteria bacterium]MCW8928214.1 D-glycero-beta-D-manno-heptose 1,7-bisphosphate 7-phosphatase [Gammaproteobacteria bacterium]MCW8958600.1 D-glycero-beta-D-manno-heptose 1,7-bisphosphate 7-phosphatase [Gammaproteobacteria bacterium]MCW8971955.1 D-glycero-beta-D-manno-heptose 1,7-bisphosphate 7-phosphatase [Gammaprot
MKLIILDRDGVINQDSDDFIKSVDEFIPLPGSLEAIARLNQAGYRVAVATNQSGIARGYYGISTLNAMHDKLRRLLAVHGGSIEMIAFCPHAPDDGCDCRKPKPGMYRDIARRMEIPLENTIVIGDSLRDLEAARAVAAKPVLVRTGKGQKTLDKGVGVDDTPVYDDLLAAVNALVEEN